MDSFNATLEQCPTLLVAERSRYIQPADLNLDVGKTTAAGMYKLSDDVYAKLVDEWAKLGFGGMPAELRDDILKFYENQNGPVSSQTNPKLSAKLQRHLQALRETPPFSRT